MIPQALINPIHIGFLRIASGSPVIRDDHGQTLGTIRPYDSKLHARAELVAPNGVMIAMFKKKVPTAHDCWNVHDPFGEKLFTIKKAHMIQNQTVISVSCKKDLLGLSLDPPVYALKADGPAGYPDDNGADKPGLKTAEWAAKTVGEPLLSDSGVFDNLEHGVQETDDKGKGSKHLKFHIKGSYSGKTCAMYVADSDSKVAQMLPLEDGNPDGFLVEVNPNVNLQFIIACFAAVVTMKNEGQRLRELAGHVVSASSSVASGVFFGAGKFLFDVVTGGS